ncbi:MAG: FtsX-like permease family protein [Bacteroidales bacterium]|nr:FtsX-like permease family protein [Bacteroidales bacterium]
MNIYRRIAVRYLFAKKSHNIINFISIMSLIGIAVATGALLIVLSVFNGLQNFVATAVNSFNADIQIVPKTGKTFSSGAVNVAEIEQMKDVLYCSEVLSDVAVWVHDDKQVIANVKGVRDDYYKINSMDTIVKQGSFVLNEYGQAWAVVGGEIAYRLSVDGSGKAENMLKVYYPNRTKKLKATAGMSALNSQSVIPSGVFYSYTEYDAQYVIVPMEFAQKLLGYYDEYTSLEIKCKPGTINKVQKQLGKLYGDQFFIRNTYQQEEDLYKVMQSEKWSIYAILSFILLIAAFNMMGMMAILILEKKSEVKVFYALGADNAMLRKIFMHEGMLIAGIGLLIGMVLGLVFCFLQYRFGLITFGDGHYLIDSYPVEIHLFDVVMIVLVVLLLTFPAVYWPSKKMSVFDNVDL